MTSGLLVNTIGQCLADSTGKIQNAKISDSARLDAECLLAFVLQKSRAYFYSHAEITLSTLQLQQFEKLLAGRLAGQPIAYLTGRREFWSLELQVNEHVLIPRPDTETLVETVLQLDLPACATVAELGTGSGAIALALASERPQWTIVASDIEAASLQVADGNRRRLGSPSVHMLQADWLSACGDGVFDLVLSNPPYIAEDDPHLSRGDLRFEPRRALVAAGQGLQDLEKIASDASRCLKKGGYIGLEHGYQQAVAVASLLQAQGFSGIRCIEDLSNQPRMTLASL